MSNHDTDTPSPLELAAKIIEGLEKERRELMNRLVMETARAGRRFCDIRLCKTAAECGYAGRCLSANREVNESGRPTPCHE